MNELYVSALNNNFRNFAQLLVYKYYDSFLVDNNKNIYIYNDE